LQATEFHERGRRPREPRDHSIPLEFAVQLGYNGFQSKGLVYSIEGSSVRGDDGWRKLGYLALAGVGLTQKEEDR
jgi:hypothetical protein